MTLDQNSYVYRTFICISIVILIATIYVICNVAMKPEGMDSKPGNFGQALIRMITPPWTLAAGGIAPASPRKPFDTTPKM
uniref:Uncharacterized protein n=1 Tax=Romanomermis culicivorax TaxID=13658 RepID=A0A915JSE2_ROMCU